MKTLKNLKTVKKITKSNMKNIKGGSILIRKLIEDGILVYDTTL